MVIELKHLTDKQRRAHFMRFHYGWRMERIGLAMGITQPCVSRLLQRALRRAGLPPCRNLVSSRQTPSCH
jgi:DNA-directed RNA polymerase specialized sigma24 family protein